MKGNKMKILMVCLGNICRSPLAEGILQAKAAAKGLDWEIDSAGTGRWHVGQEPDSRSIAVAKKHGLDISHQRGRQFRAGDLDRFDLIFAMDSSNYQDIMRHANSPDDKAKIHLIMNMAEPGKNQAVPDPYYGTDGFDLVYDMLDRACEGIVKKYGG